MATRMGWSPGPAAWKDDLTPIAAADWNYDRAAHLLTHAGFGGTPAEIQKLADAGLERRGPLARALREHPELRGCSRSSSRACGIPTLNGFPESRPEATDRAEKHGSSMGVESKPSGNRPVQPVSDRFFYWLRATMLETRRLGYWWANRMLQTTHPVEQKMALLWHGHFATHENKVRDYRKMMQQIDLFERGATGNLRDLTIQVAQNPAMLYFLDAQYNVKGAPERELRPRGDGALHHGRRQLLREGRARMRARVHRLVFRQPHVQGRPGQARRRREDVPGSHRDLRRRRRAEDHLRAAGDGGISGRQDLPLPGAGRVVAGAAQEARRGPARARLRRQAAADGHLLLEGLLLLRRATAATSKGRSSTWSR